MARLTIKGADAKQAEGLAPLYSKGGDRSQDSYTNPRGKKKGINIPFINAISYKDLVFLTRELSILLNASVPIVQALHILTRQVKNPRLSEIIAEIADNVEGGMPLSQALTPHQKIFGNLFVSLVKTGEVSGTLDKSLTYIADELEKDYVLRSKIKGALAYPIFVLVAMSLVMGLLFTFVMPKMLQMLTETGATLPITTRILVGITNIFANFWWLFIIVIIGAIIVYKYTNSQSWGKIFWDRQKLRIPIMGPILQKVYLERFARNFGILAYGGVPVVQALRITADGIGNEAYRKALMATADDVENGQSMAQAMSTHGDVIPELIVQMVEIGEKTSKIDEIMTKMSGFYERESSQSVNNLTQLLEPVIMLVLGGMVALIVSGILLPIYNLVGAQ
ncbi:MAG TPA: type II secretion system F family protein [Flavobacterium sp.]|nr:type II secretion system F family protein [Flavobacterium sp.]